MLLSLWTKPVCIPWLTVVTQCDGLTTFNANLLGYHYRATALHSNDVHSRMDAFHATGLQYWFSFKILLSLPLPGHFSILQLALLLQSRPVWLTGLNKSLFTLLTFLFSSLLKFYNTCHDPSTNPGWWVRKPCCKPLDNTNGNAGVGWDTLNIPFHKELRFL